VLYRINQKHKKLCEKLKFGKITDPYTNSLFIRVVTGEKKTILIVALYNGTHNSIIY